MIHSRTDHPPWFQGGPPRVVPLLLVLLAGATLLSAQIRAGEYRPTRSFVSESRQRVEACVPTSHTPEQTDEARADASDAEIVCRNLYRTGLSKEESAAMEAAALRRLERRKAKVEKVQRLVDAGALPLDVSDAAMKEVDSAVKDYVLAVTRTALPESPEARETAPLWRGPAVERFDGDSSFTREDCNRVLRAYEKQFNKSMPVSAHGETAVHRALGYDHRNRMDVALFPDTVEGLWLRRYLEANDIPYYAFRSYVPGKATAAHIHIGPPSSRLRITD